MGRGSRAGAEAHGDTGGRTRVRRAARAAVLRRRLGTSDGAELTLDELSAVAAVRAGWIEPVAVPAIRLIDALWHRDFEDVADQARRLRRELAAAGVAEHHAARISAGLALHRAQGVVASLHGTDTDVMRRTLRRNATAAKREGLFPWHLLDG